MSRTLFASLIVAMSCGMAAAEAPGVAAARIQVGDQVIVSVYELVALDTETVYTARVDQRGMIKLPVMGEVKVGGMTAEQAKKFIAHLLEYKLGILRDPIVGVKIGGREGAEK